MENLGLRRQVSEEAIGITTENPMNFWLRDEGRPLQEIKVTLVVRLANMGGQHGTVPVRVARLGQNYRVLDVSY
jgi:hypothetical protein